MLTTSKEQKIVKEKINEQLFAAGNEDALHFKNIGLDEAIFDMSIGKIGKGLKRLKSLSHGPGLTFNQRSLALLIALNVAADICKYSVVDKLNREAVRTLIKACNFSELEQMYIGAMNNSASFAVLAYGAHKEMSNLVKTSKDKLLVKALKGILKKGKSEYNKRVKTYDEVNKRMRTVEFRVNVIRFGIVAVPYILKLGVALLAALAIYFIIQLGIGGM